MNISEIKKLVKIVEESKIADLEVSRWGQKVRISKYGGNSLYSQPGAHTQVYLHEPAGMGRAAHDAIPEPASANLSGQLASSPPAKPEADRQDLVEIKSPMVGTFYRAPAPDAEPYVDVGSTVSTGQVLCIIEAMKLMNEIEAEFPCKIVEILVDNEKPVEYNQPLFRVEKV